MHMYEFDTRVPFMMSGPGIVGGTIVDRIVGSTDLAPTFLAIAGVVTPSDMDGKSLLPIVVSAPSVGVARPPKSCQPDPCNGNGVCLQPLKGQPMICKHSPRGSLYLTPPVSPPRSLRTTPRHSCKRRCLSGDI